ncbi:MAG: hypothetical protein ACRDIY_10090 [Chloroflexota bacterium]
MGTATGNATYYCLCFGGSCDNGTGGACGDCNDGSYDIAWAYVYSDDSCDEVQHGCHTSVSITDVCTTNSYSGSIEDACPCKSQEGCSATPLCSGSSYTDPNYAEPLLDLTTAYFMALDGSLDDGRIPISITI